MSEDRSGTEAHRMPLNMHFINRLSNEPWRLSEFYSIHVYKVSHSNMESGKKIFLLKTAVLRQQWRFSSWKSSWFASLKASWEGGSIPQPPAPKKTEASHHNCCSFYQKYIYMILCYSKLHVFSCHHWWPVRPSVTTGLMSGFMLSLDKKQVVKAASEKLNLKSFFFLFFFLPIIG